MAPRYCEVALPVPLRSTFTYSVPEQFDGEPLIGRRVVVPFRSRSMVGLCVSESDHAPEEVRAHFDFYLERFPVKVEVR